MLAHWLVRIQRHQFTLDDCLGTLTGRINEVLVDFYLSTLLLDAQEEVVRAAESEDLELLIPLTVNLWVEPVQRGRSLADAVQV